MGLFDKIKSAVNKLTGGGAKITLEITRPKLREPFQVSVKAIISDADLKAGKVYLNVRALEKINLKKNINGQSHDIVEDHELVKAEYLIADAQHLVAKQEYSWSKQIQLPANARSSFSGKYSALQWQFQAGLDVSGNDPDSGWVTLEIID